MQRSCRATAIAAGNLEQQLVALKPRLSPFCVFKFGLVAGILGGQDQESGTQSKLRRHVCPQMDCASSTRQNQHIVYARFHNRRESVAYPAVKISCSTLTLIPFDIQAYRIYWQQSLLPPRNMHQSKLLTSIGLLALHPHFSTAYWRMACDFVQTARVDPILNPGTLGSHVHAFAGGNSQSIRL